MTALPLPAPGMVSDILIWHQGALGDLLLSGPALSAISRHYPRARLTALGNPRLWGLLSGGLPLAAIWDSSAAQWSELFAAAPVSPGLRGRLAPFPLAFVFSPQPSERLQAKLVQAGIPRVEWIPSFPADNGAPEPVTALQARRLAGLGLTSPPAPFCLRVGREEATLPPELRAQGPWLAVAPGSGHDAKNWPLSHFYEVVRSLAWEHRLKVVWLAGPAEGGMLPYLAPLAAAQGHHLLAEQPLGRVAAVLSQARLYLGNDSGLTHLAAAAGATAVLAVFGPTDPRVWAPRGQQVRVLSGPCSQAPCAAGREISCPRPRCLEELAPETVLAAAAAMLQV